MDKISCNRILDSIKSDDLVDFSQLIKGNENLCFGRFPILSLCYLYNAKKIIKKYESLLLKISNYKICTESFDIYQKFRSVAGRCMRLYLEAENVVSPIEMLAILQRDNFVKRNFKFYCSNEKVCSNVKIIYETIYGRTVIIDKDTIKVGRAQITYSQKRFYKLATILSTVFVILCVAGMFIQGSTTGLGTKWSTAKIYTQNQFVSALKSNGNCELKNNITLNGDIDVNFSGTIDGKNNTIFVDATNSFLLSQNNGTIKNLNIVYNVVDGQISNSFSLLTQKNNGTLENVQIVCNTLNLDCQKNKDNDIYVSGFANINNGYIKNCSLKLNGQIDGNLDGECYVSGFVGVNNGIVNQCEFKIGSQICTKEADVAGFVSTNGTNAQILNCKNYSELMQTSLADGWSPNVSGIVQTNFGTLENCFNHGKLLIVSENQKANSSAVALLGGLASFNYGKISHSINSGDLKATTKTITIYCGGISAYSSYWVENQKMILPIIESCGSQSQMDVESQDEKAYAFVGGISGFLWGEMNNCFSACTYLTSYDESKYFVASCLGSSFIFNNIIYITARNNYVLSQDNVQYQIGALVNNGIIVTGGQDSPASEIITIATLELLQQKDVYWYEE